MGGKPRFGSFLVIEPSSDIVWAFQRAAPRRANLFAQLAPHDMPACSRSADFMKPCC
jgi:hypothetical protein